MKEVLSLEPRQALPLIYNCSLSLLCGEPISDHTLTTPRYLQLLSRLI